MGGGLLNVFHINHYVRILLEYCFLFWLVSITEKYYSKKTANTLLIAGVLISSLITYFFFKDSKAAGWCYERLGLIWGVVLYTNMNKIKKWINPSFIKIMFFGVTALVLGIAYLKFKPIFFLGEYLLKIVLGVAIINVLFTVSCKRIFGNRIINFLGDISYEVYLTHGFVMGVICHFSPNISSGVFILTTVICTLLLSSVLHEAGKRIVAKLRV